MAPKKKFSAVGTSMLRHKSLGECMILTAQISQSGRKIFIANYGTGRKREQAILSAEPHYWSESPGRAHDLWERLAPKIKLTPGKRVDSDDEEDDLADVA